MGILGFFGVLWGKLLIVLAIIVAVMALILRIQTKAERAGKLEEQATQRMRNAKIKKAQEQDALTNRPDISNIESLLDQL